MNETNKGIQTTIVHFSKAYLTQFFDICYKKIIFFMFLVLDERDSKKIIRINRGCGWELYKGNRTETCYNADTDFKYEESCQCFTDACNPAPSTYNFQRPGLLALPLILMAQILRF